MKTIGMMTAAVAALLLAGCGDKGGSEPNQSSVVANTQATAADNAMAMDPNDPFSSAEKQMHEGMMAAKGQNADETWLRKMIEHHKGAIAMSEVVIAQGGNPKVAAMARQTADMQRKEVAALERMLDGDTTPTAVPEPKASLKALPKTTAAPAPKAPEKAVTPAPTPQAEDPHAGHKM